MIAVSSEGDGEIERHTREHEGLPPGTKVARYHLIGHSSEGEGEIDRHSRGDEGLHLG